MNIELTEVMQKEIIKQVSDRLYAQISKQIHLPSIVAEVRKDITSVLVSKAAGEFHKKVNVENIVTTHIAEIENRINTRIEKLMKKGITLTLMEE